MQTDFVSIGIMMVGAQQEGTKKWFGLQRIWSCRIARNLGDQGRWLPIGPAVTYDHTLPRPAGLLNLLQNPG